mmetsp:Transcript_91874/g.230911  ORF Transcript_91874/g.230911 Transcript_91874/m.230911 type:complete len:469 (-) Transcript_91874:225-1631(-)
MNPEFSTLEGKAALTNILSELHRIIERQPTDIQRVLNQLGKDHALNEEGTCFPRWANGAHVFITADVADEIQEALEGEDLKPCDVIVAEQFREWVDAAIAANCPEPRSGHGKPLKLKPGQSKQYHMVESSAAFFRAFYSEMRRLNVRPASLPSRGCASTGYKQRLELVKLPHMQDAPCEGGSSPEADEDVRDDRTIEADTASIAATLDGIASDDLAEVIVQRLLDELCDEKPPLGKSEQAFSGYVVERLDKFRHDILKRLIDELELEFGSQMRKQVTREEAKSYLDGYVKMLETKLFGGDVFIKYLKSGKKALEREQKGSRGEPFVKAWSESLDIFAMDIKEEIGKTMLVAKKAAWKMLRPDLDRFASDNSVDISHKVGRLLIECVGNALADANPRKVAAAAYKKQRDRYRASRTSQSSASQSPPLAALDKKPLAERPAWMREEARRHLDAGGSSGQYDYACGYDGGF